MTRVEHIGDATLYLGDCRDVLPTLGPVDAVVTDPPYGIAATWKGGAKHGWGAARAKSAVRNSWDIEPVDPGILDALLALCCPTIIFGANHFTLPPSRCWLIWRKEVNPALTLGDAEVAWTNLTKPIRVFDHPRSKLTGHRVPEHPTQKPLALMEWCLSHLPAKTRTVCDPFAGSGTTGVACVKRGLRFVGIEREPRYFDIACRRIEQAQRQGDMFRIAAPKPEEKPKQEALL